MQHIWLVFRHNKLLFIPAICLLIKVTLCLREKVKHPWYSPSWAEVSCHYFLNNDEDALPNISLNFNPSEKSIFFLETSCKRSLNSRQICSVESAARHHPHSQVNVLFPGPVLKRNFEGRGLTVLRKLQNVKLLRLYILDYAKNTPLYEMIKKGALIKSQFRIVHTSDLLRILTLYKFGGVYLDLDMVVVKPLWSLGNNWIVRETNYLINNAAMAITRNKLGLKFIRKLVNHVKINYRGDLHIHNGPVAVTEVMRNMCSTWSLLNMSSATCQGFHVYGQEYFYGVPFADSRLFFKPGKKLFPDAYAYHIWNSGTQNYPIYNKSRYADLAREHCPATYKAFGDDFGA